MIKHKYKHERTTACHKALEFKWISEHSARIKFVVTRQASSPKSATILYRKPLCKLKFNTIGLKFNN